MQKSVKKWRYENLNISGKQVDMMSYPIQEIVAHLTMLLSPEKMGNSSEEKNKTPKMYFFLRRNGRLSG